MKPKQREVALGGDSIRRLRRWFADNPAPSSSQLRAELDEIGVPTSWEGVESAFVALGAAHGYGAPAHVGSFVAELAESRGARSVLDPHASSPVLASATAEMLPDARTVAFTPVELVAKMGEVVMPSVDWELGAISGGLRVSDQFDFVVCAPPLGAKPKHPPSRSELGDLANSLLVDSADHLEKGGTLAFLVSDAFFFRQDASRARKILSEQGLRLEAAISIGSQAARNGGSSIPTSLVVFSFGEPLDHLFVGRLDSFVDPGALVRNLARRAHGEYMQLGLFYPTDRYRGWKALVNEVELLEQMGRLDIPIADLDEVALRFTRAEGDGAESENSIYIPEYLNSKVTSEPPENPKGFTRVDIDSDRASARWIAQWLNEPLGRVSRASLAVGPTIERLLPRDLGRLRVGLPSREIQNATVGVSQNLRLFEAEAVRVHERLWAGELSLNQAQDFVSRIQETIEKQPSEVVSAPTPEAWIEHLPFPLAGIGRRYLAVAPTREKVDHLQHFFEAYAILITTVLISALRRDAEAYQLTVDKVSEAARGGNSPLDRADFGTWINLGRTVAKKIRTLLNEDKSGTYQSVLCGNLSGQSLRAMVEKGFWSELDAARDIRNERGHGGIEGEKWLGEKLVRLQTLLTELRTSHSDVFQSVDLVRPGSSEQMEDGRFEFNRAERLMGSNWTFHERKVECTGSMIAKDLYLVPSSGIAEDPLHLIPLVQLRKVPESEERAVYFYNRKLGSNEGTGFRFISYDFEGRPEEEVLDQSISRLLLDLTPS